MSQELTHQQTENKLAAMPEPASMMHAIQRAASDPNVDVAKMEALLAMAERMQATTARIQYQDALARVQANMPRILKDGQIVIEKQGMAPRVQSRYAKLENINRLIKPLLSEEGFALSFDSDFQDGRVVVIGTLTHRAGHSEQKKVMLPIDSSGAKNGVQGVGSTISYAQRYLVKMFLNIVEEGLDNDGNGPEPTITQDQVLLIRDLIAQTNSDEKRLLEFAKAGSLAEIPQSRYQIVVSTLEKKVRR